MASNPANVRTKVQDCVSLIREIVHIPLANDTLLMGLERILDCVCYFILF